MDDLENTLILNKPSETSSVDATQAKTAQLPRLPPDAAQTAAAEKKEDDFRHGQNRIFK